MVRLTRRSPPAQVHSITGAQASLHDDLSGRMRKYLISMSVRTACFVLAVVLQGWMRWTCAVAAIVLPYIAVVIANAGPTRQDAPPAFTAPRQSLDDDRHPKVGP